MENQTTLKNRFTLSGRGLHTGKNVTVTLCPAAPNTGILYRRMDVEPAVEIPVRADLVVDTARGTTLGMNGLRISTGEHLHAALHGLQVDNVLIEIDGEEVPILDGSAKPWVEGIQKAGLEEQEAERKYFTLREPISMGGTGDGIEYIAMPSDQFRVTTIIDFKSDVIGKQVAEIQGYDSFAEEISRCRTFVFLHEILQLLQFNLIKGGDLDNALVFVDHPLVKDHAEALAKIYGKKMGSFKVENGVLNTVKPYYPNEPARHKLLDFMGDILLVGCPIKAHFIIKCPGHKSNVAFAQFMRNIIADVRQQEQRPTYDPNAKPAMTADQICSFIPHRYPFLLVDKIIEIGPDYVVGVKNVTINEPYYAGHFPDRPVMPGVLQLEAMAQVGGIYAIRDIQDPQNYTTLLARIDGVRFRQTVVPGDTLILKVKIQGPIRRGYIRMKGTAYVGETIVTEATLVAQIIKKDTTKDTQ